MLSYSKIFHPKTIIYAIILIISELVLLFLALSCIQNFQNDSVRDMVALASQKTALKLTFIENIGRNISRYGQLEQEINELLENTQASGAAVVSINGRILLNKNTDIDSFNAALIDENKLYHSTKEPKLKYAAIPYYDASQNIKGYVLTTVKLKSNAQMEFLKKNITRNFLITLAISLIIFFIYSAFLHLKAHRTVSRAKSFLIPLIVIQLISITILAIPSVFMAREYISSLEISAGKALSQELSRINTLGIKTAEIPDLDKTLISFKSAMHNIGYMSIYNQNKQLLAGDDVSIGTIQPICNKQETFGYLKIALDRKKLFNIFIKYGFDMLTMLLIASLLAYELSYLLDILISKYEKPKALRLFSPQLARPLGYLGILSLYLPVSIVPLYIKSIQEESIFGLPENIYMSLPVSIDMTAICLASLSITILGNQISWKKLLFTGIILLASAMTISFSASSALIFLFSRVLYGLGYSCFIISLQLFVISFTKAQERGKIFSHLTSGLFAGSLCSCALGGICADTLGYQAVFKLSSYMLCAYLCLLIYLAYFFKDQKIQQTNLKHNLKLTALLSFISKKEIIALLLFQVLPYGAIAIGVFNYFLPVILNKNGFGASAVGQLNIFYTVIVIFLSPFFGKILDKSLRKYRLLTIGLCISAIAPLCFILPYPILACALAMICLGLSSSINESGQPAFISSLPQSSIIGETQSVLILDLFIRIGQILGPILISVSLYMAANSAFIYISIGCIISALLFMSIQRKRP